MAVHERIEINPKIMLGKPVIRGSRITVEPILRKISEGADERALLQAYPHLMRETSRRHCVTQWTRSRTKKFLSRLPDSNGSKSVQLVADESCDFSIVVGTTGGRSRCHLDRGFDEGALKTIRSLSLRARKRRLLLTEDKDSGQLVFSRSDLTETVTKLLPDHGEALYGCFVVLESGR